MAKWVVLYAAILAGVVSSYSPAKEAMIRQDAWVRVIDSPLTINVVLALFIWGVVADKWTKGMARKKSWLIWGAGLVVLIVMFRLLGGIPTVFG